jgi:hypothetical protein
MVWHGRHLLVSALRTTLWEADQADEVLGIAEIQVAAIAAVHGASIPGGLLRADGVIIIPGPVAARPAGCAAARPWAGAGGLAGGSGPAAVPPRRVRASAPFQSGSRCSSAVLSATQPRPSRRRASRPCTEATALTTHGFASSRTNPAAAWTAHAPARLGPPQECW